MIDRHACETCGEPIHGGSCVDVLRAALEQERAWKENLYDLTRGPPIKYRTVCLDTPAKLEEYRSMAPDARLGTTLHIPIHEKFEPYA